MARTDAHHAFAVGAFSKTGESVIATQRAFRYSFHVMWECCCSGLNFQSIAVSIFNQKQHHSNVT